MYTMTFSYMYTSATPVQLWFAPILTFHSATEGSKLQKLYVHVHVDVRALLCTSRMLLLTNTTQLTALPAGHVLMPDVARQ